MNIPIMCETADYLPWRSITPIQEGYKERTETDIQKLCNLILKRGIRFPAFVARVDGAVLGVDTHGRLLAYERLEAQGHVIPPIPVVFVKAKDKGEVKQLLLECDSRYGAVTKQSALNFIGDLSVDFSNLSIPDAGTLTFDDLSIDIDSFFENSDYTREKKIKLCPHCGKPI